jgi:ribosomal protein S12 methylthiotransferase accessory factor
MGWDLLQQREMAVPFTQVSMGNCKHQRTKRWLPFASGSNGLAGGNHMLEALAAALYELVERDAVACAAFAGSIHKKRVALSSIENPLVLSLLDKLDAASITAYLFDCTVDTGVPTYMAVIEDHIDITMGLYKGYGAHLDPAIAMIRAITEAAQSRLLLIAGSRDDYFLRDQHVNRYLSASRSNVLDVPESCAARLQASQATTSFAADVHILLSKLQAIGIQSAVVVDLTNDEIGIPVVRVIVPGLEGYMFDHYQPGWHAKSYRARMEVCP